MARYIPEARLLIQHIPRCGGTWVQEAVDACGIKCVRWVSKQPPWVPKKHALLGHYYRDQLVKIYLVAVFVRHPVAYYESVWRWLSDQTPRRRLRIYDASRTPEDSHFRKWCWHPHASAARVFDSVEDSDFSGWVGRMLIYEPLWCTRLFEQYIGPEGGEIVDFIGRTEKLEDDFRLLMGQVGFEPGEIDVGLSNKSETPKPSWSPSLKQEVEKMEAGIIGRFYGEDQGRLFGRLKHDQVPVV